MTNATTVTTDTDEPAGREKRSGMFRRLRASLRTAGLVGRSMQHMCSRTSGTMLSSREYTSK